MRPLLAAALLALAITPALAAQMRPLRLTALRDMTFGAVLPGVAVVVAPNDPSRSARFDVAGEKFSRVELFFSLPAQMTTPGAAMPLAFGASSAGFSPTGAAGDMVAFDPRARFVGTLSSTGRGTVFLGGAALPAPAQRAGSYTGAVTLTVSILTL